MTEQHPSDALRARAAGYVTAALNPNLFISRVDGISILTAREAVIELEAEAARAES
jgi:hypothetical protein